MSARLQPWAALGQARREAKIAKQQQLWLQMYSLVEGNCDFEVHEDARSVHWKRGNLLFGKGNLVHLQRFLQGRRYRTHVQAQQLQSFSFEWPAEVPTVALAAKGSLAWRCEHAA